MHGTDKAVAERHIKQAKAKEFVKQVQHALNMNSIAACTTSLLLLQSEMYTKIGKIKNLELVDVVNL